MLLTTVIVLFGGSNNNPLSSRAPTEAELQEFVDSMSIEVLTKKFYTDSLL